MSFSPGASHTTPIYDRVGERDGARAEVPRQHPIKPASCTGHSWPHPGSRRLRPGLWSPAIPHSPSWMLPSLWPHPAQGSCASPRTESTWQPLSSLRPLLSTGVTATQAWRQDRLSVAPQEAGEVLTDLTQALCFPLEVNCYTLATLLDIAVAGAGRGMELLWSRTPLHTS